MRLLLACLALLLAANAAAQIYRWTDEKGRVVYGNEPPAGTKPEVVQDRINSYGGPPEMRQAVPVVRSDEDLELVHQGRARELPHVIPQDSIRSLPASSPQIRASKPTAPNAPAKAARRPPTSRPSQP